MAGSVALVGSSTATTGGIDAASLTVPAPSGLASTDLQFILVACRYPDDIAAPAGFTGVGTATSASSDASITSSLFASVSSGVTVGAGGSLGDITIQSSDASAFTAVAVRFAVRSTSAEYAIVQSGFDIGPTGSTTYDLPALTTSGIPDGSFIFGQIVARIGTFSGGAEPPTGSTMLAETTASIAYAGIVEKPWADADTLTTGTIQSAAVTSAAMGVYDPSGTADVVAGGRAAKIATSIHGTIGWTQRTSGFGGSNVIIRLSHSPELGLWIAGGYDRYSTSPDAITWTLRTFPLPASHGIWAAEWSPDLALFVVAGDDGRLYTSTDGISYTSRTSGLAGQIITDCVWSADLGLFVVVGDAGGLATSPDGTTWTTRTSGFSGSAIHTVTWSSDLGLFVAAGDSSKIGTSTNGTSWTVATTGVATARTAVWSPEAAVFVVAGDSGALKSSPDGTTWTTRTSQFGTSPVMGSTWAANVGVAGMFIIVGNGGKMATSTDGITWTTRTSSFGTTEIFDVHAMPSATVVVPPTSSGPTVGFIGFGVF